MTRFRLLGALSMLSMLLTFPIYAGADRGNGGDVIICRDSQGNVTSMEMADLFEARTIRNIPIDLGEPSLTPEQKAHLAVDRLITHDPLRAAYFHSVIDSFMSKVWLVDFELPDLNDTGELTVPPGCSIHQIAIHKERETPNDKEFWIRKAYWDAPEFNNDQKAALILHETVFGKLIEQGHRDSRKARAVTSYLASPTLAEMTYEQYEALILVKLGAASHYYYFKDRDAQDLVSQIYYIPTRKSDFDEASAFCKNIAPSADIYTDRDEFNDSRRGPGVPNRQAASLLSDLKRDHEDGWIWQSPNGCAQSWYPTYLTLNEDGSPRIVCERASVMHSALCECTASANDPNSCKPY